MKVKVAAMQFTPRHRQYEENWKKIESLIESASKEDVKLAVLPEMCTTGYIFEDRKDISELVESIPGPTTNKLVELARKHDMYIVVGLAEKDEEDIYYNASALVGPEGYIGKYRKMNQFIADSLWASDGDLPLEAFDTKIGKIGMAICFDMNIEETCAVLKRRGCQIICAPSNWFGESEISTVWMTRAYEHKIPVVVSNRGGQERRTKFNAKGCIIDEKGMVLDFVANNEGMAIADIEVSEVQQLEKKDFYKELSRHTFVWNPTWYFKQTKNKLPKGEDIQVAVIQLKSSDIGSFAQNKKLIKKWMVNELNTNTKLILFPENILCGIDKSVTPEEVRILADELCPILSNYEAYVVVSGKINEQGKTSNRVYLIGKNGIVGEYKRIFSTQHEFDEYGEEPVFLDTEYGRLGFLFGDELTRMEPARVLALSSIDLLLVTEKDGREYNRFYDDDNTLLWSLAMDRGRQNNFYVMHANYVGGGSAGFSGIFGPNAFEKPDDRVYSERLEGSIKMFVHLKETSRLFPSNRIKYKPLLHFRKPYFYRDIH